MCGRYTLIETNRLIDRFHTYNGIDGLKPNYNAAPSQNMPVIVEGEKGYEQKLMKWGLVPAWSKDHMGFKLINARSETIGEKPTFRSAYKKRRCIVPANGYYEWKSINGKKQPYYIQLADNSLFGFAGIWEYWEKPEYEPIYSYSIITSAAEGAMSELHERVPVILNKEVEEAWLNGDISSSDRLRDLLRHNQASELSFYPVAIDVNKVSNNYSDLIKENV